MCPSGLGLKRVSGGRPGGTSPRLGGVSMAINYKMNSITCHEFLYRFAKLGCSFVLKYIAGYQGGREGKRHLAMVGRVVSLNYLHIEAHSSVSPTICEWAGGLGLLLRMGLLSKSNKKEQGFYKVC